MKQIINYTAFGLIGLFFIFYVTLCVKSCKKSESYYDATSSISTATDDIESDLSHLAEALSEDEGIRDIEEGDEQIADATVVLVDDDESDKEVEMATMNNARMGEIMADNSVDSVTREEIKTAREKGDNVEKGSESTAKGIEEKTVYYVVAGSFESKENARNRLEAMGNLGYESEIVRFSASKYHSVRVGTFETRKEAKKLVKELKGKGMPTLIVKRKEAK